MILLHNAESVVDAAGITGTFLLSLGSFPVPCRDGVTLRCFLLVSPPLQPLPVSCPVPILQYKLFPFPVSTCPQFFVCLWRFCPSAFPHSIPFLPSLRATKIPHFSCHLLVSSSALSPCCIPTSLGSPASLLNLSTDNPHCLLSAHILKHRHISHRWK